MRSFDPRLPAIAVALLVVTACAGAPSPSTVPSQPTAPTAPTTTEAATAGPPSISPTASASVAPKLEGQIVFDDFGDNFLHTQIWIEAADGSNVRKLVSDEFTDYAPALSPDGSTVVFTRGANDQDTIMLVNIDGTDLRAVDTGAADGCKDAVEGGDAWSPDGRRLAFFRLCVKTAVWGIWTINFDGTDAREVTKNNTSPEVLARFLNDGVGFEHLEDHRPGWSPDGKRIAFARIDTSYSPELSAIFTVAIDGTDLRQVTDWKVDANDPDWSPDGSLIAFNASAEPSPTQNIYTIHPDGTGLTQLTKGLSTNPDGGQGTYHPSWSPDGTKILFSHNPSTGGFADFFVMNRDGSDLHVLAKTALEENRAHWGRSPGG